MSANYCQSLEQHTVAPRHHGVVMYVLTFPQHALQMLPLQLTDDEPQQTLMPLEHALACACVLKRSTARKLMQRMRDGRRILV